MSEDTGWGFRVGDYVEFPDDEIGVAHRGNITGFDVHGIAIIKDAASGLPYSRLPEELTRVEHEHRDSPKPLKWVAPIPGDSGEIRTTSSTGAQKGVKPVDYSLIPWDAMAEVAEHYHKGAEKYSSHNWRAGYEWSKSFAALMRHATNFWAGQDRDPETGSHEMAAVVFHALALLEYARTHPEFDDRYKGD